MIVIPPSVGPDPIAGLTATALELLMARGWQGTSSATLGGWQLRAGHGFTGRANSVLPLADPEVPFDEALDTADRFYRSHDLPTVLQIPSETNPYCGDLDSLLHADGWEAFNATAVMVGAIPSPTPIRSPPERPVSLRLDLRSTPDEAWLRGYLYRGAILPDTAIRVLTNADHVTFASLRDAAGQVRAVARSVVTDGWLGVTAVTVDVDHQRRGLGTALMQHLVGHGSDNGADHVYLQVDEANSGAISMYRQQGFRRHHGYHYRRRATV